VVREALKRFAPDLDKSGSVVTIRGEAPVGRWDRSLLERMFENLLTNAIKFGSGKPIEIAIGLQAGSAQVTVKDLGIGIHPAQQARIFERFGRAVSEEHYGGLGLGLYICRKIVEAHGGCISVVSQPGEGSAFTVELPLLERPEPSV
jgi:signal transduction histidine kinase